MNPQKKMKSRVNISLLILLFASFLFTGCDKAKETVEEAADNVAEKTGEMISETAEKVGEVAEETVEKVGESAEEAVNKLAEGVEEIVEAKELIGTWKGKFDGRKTVLVITSQDENDFSGKITINYRDVINQEVKGSFDSETNKMTMIDQLHSRFAGKYDGKLSDNKNNYSGVFTIKADGKKFNFNLKK